MQGRQQASPTRSSGRDLDAHTVTEPTCNERRGLMPVVLAVEARCARCAVRGNCLPATLDRPALDRFDANLLTVQRRLQVGDVLFGGGDPFQFVYAVQTGFFKTVLTTRQGLEQVIGFHMAGDVLGLDGIGSGVHSVAAVALEDARVCVIKFAALQRLARELPELQARFHRLLGNELVRDYLSRVELGSKYAEERLAGFVLDLADRLGVRGYSDRAFVLRMTRGELGSYLGLTVETVCRTLSKFHRARILEVAQRDVHILDRGRLQQIVDGAAVQWP